MCIYYRYTMCERSYLHTDMRARDIETRATRARSWGVSVQGFQRKSPAGYVCWLIIYNSHMLHGAGIFTYKTG